MKAPSVVATEGAFAVRDEQPLRKVPPGLMDTAVQLLHLSPPFCQLKQTRLWFWPFILPLLLRRSANAVIFHTKPHSLIRNFVQSHFSAFATKLQNAGCITRIMFQYIPHIVAVSRLNCFSIGGYALDHGFALAGITRQGDSQEFEHIQAQLKLCFKFFDSAIWTFCCWPCLLVHVAVFFAMQPHKSSYEI